MLAWRVAGGSLPGVFQGDDGEDGPPVHAAHAGAVAHVIIVDGGAVRADLEQQGIPREANQPGQLRSP